MIMQLITASSSEFPVGTFNVENTYDYVYPVGNTLSGKPILNVGGADPLGLGVGTWYYYIGPNDEGQMAVLDGAGAVIKQGSINITTSDNKRIISPSTSSTSTVITSPVRLQLR